MQSDNKLIEEQLFKIHYSWKQIVTFHADPEGNG